MILYKYLPLSWVEGESDAQKNLFQKRCQCIRDNKFWFSKPDRLNDPYDCRPFFSVSKNLRSIIAIFDGMTPEEVELVLEKFPGCATKEDVCKLFEKISNSANTKVEVKDFLMRFLQSLGSGIVKAKIANVGVLSLTEDPKNIVMWAQYANNHRGVCIEIDIPANTRSLKKVAYTRLRPEFEVYEAMDEKHGRFFDLFYTKSMHWSSEVEWRMVARQGDEAKTISGAIVSKIIYGINASNETKEKITGFVGQDIPVHQLTMKRNYGLDWDS